MWQVSAELLKLGSPWGLPQRELHINPVTIITNTITPGEPPVPKEGLLFLTQTYRVRLMCSKEILLGGIGWSGEKPGEASREPALPAPPERGTWKRNGHVIPPAQSVCP